MTFVSYAQNFEDVMLWRALGQVGNGFYIDVGAADADLYSVTRAFYDRGWSGLAIEPAPFRHHRLAAARPRDRCLNIALGAMPGEVTLYIVGQSNGLTTTDAATAARHRAAGWPVREERVPVRTLADLSDDLPGQVHFLKIDAEGAEPAVLQGADFGRLRPWIVLVEAIAAGTRKPCHAEWEALLLQAGYRFVWFDGLNRFYVAEEHFAALGPAFAAPPNVFDDFIRPADAEHFDRIIAGEQRAAAAEARAAEAERRSAEAEGRTAAAERRIADAERRTAEAEHRAAEAERRNAEAATASADLAIRLHAAEARATAAEAARAEAEQQLTALRAAPLQRFAAALRRARPGLPRR